MKRRITLMISTVFLAFLSCEKPVQNFELKIYEPEIVLNGLLYQDSLLTFSVHKTAMRDNVSGNRFDVNPSEILLRRNGVELPVSKLDDKGNYFVKDVLVNQGDTYDVDISVPGLKSVSSELSVPDSVPFTIKDVALRLEKPEDCFSCDAEYYVYITLEIDDPDPANFYAVSVESFRYDYMYYDDEYPPIEDPYLYGYMTQLEIESSDGIVEFYFDYGLTSNNNVSELVGGAKLYFKDNLLPSLKNTITLKAYIGYITEMDIPLNVTLHSYSKSLYNYLRSISEYNDYSDFPLSEPIYIYSNITNGRGIFGGVNRSNKKYTLSIE